MPAVICPSCSAKLNAPASAAGKRLKCPKCQAAVPVPAADEDFDADDARPQRAKRRVDDEEDDRPRKAKRRAEEDEDEEDDRPRKKKTAGKKSNLPIILVGVAVGLFLMCGGVLAIGYWLSTPSSGPRLGTQGPVAGNANTPAADQMPGVSLPAGWVVFDDPKGEVRLHFPQKQPTKKDDPSARMNAAGAAESETWILEANGKQYTFIRSTPPAAELQPGREAATLEAAAKGMSSAIPGAKEVRTNAGVEGGRPFRNATIDLPAAGKRVFVRMEAHKGRLYILTVTQPTNTVMQPVEPDVAPFFISFWAK